MNGSWKIVVLRLWKIILKTNLKITMLFKRLLILLYFFMLISFVHAAAWSRLCERMASCDLFRFVRTHKKQITTVNEKTKRVDFLTNELQTGGKDLTQRIDILENRYQVLNEQVSTSYRPYTTDDRFDFSIDRIRISTVQLSDVIEDTIDYEVLPSEPDQVGNGSNEVTDDYEHYIVELNQVHKELHDSFIDIENEFYDLKESISTSLSGATLQTYELQSMREDVNRGEDILRSLETVLEHHFEELDLIRGFHHPINYENTNLSINTELKELNEKYSELQFEINELAINLKGMKISPKSNFEDSNDNMRYARDELKVLKSSMEALIKAMNETQYKCIDEGLEIAYKMRLLYTRMGYIGRNEANCKG